MTGGPSAGPASAYATLRRPASTCLRGANDVFVPGLMAGIAVLADWASAVASMPRWVTAAAAAAVPKKRRRSRLMSSMVLLLLSREAILPLRFDCQQRRRATLLRVSPWPNLCKFYLASARDAPAGRQSAAQPVDWA